MGKTEKEMRANKTTPCRAGSESLFSFGCYAAILFSTTILAFSIALDGIYQHTDGTTHFSRLVSSPVLLLIAHPDDEVMFFAPTIRALRRTDAEVKVLCLSNGISALLFTRGNNFTIMLTIMFR
jgi:hypothetical protein